jgi:hypothetical protein
MNTKEIVRRSRHILAKALFLTLAIALALAANAPVKAQEPRIEYGSENELQGVQRVFIYTGMNLKARDEIAKNIQKRLPSITITAKQEDAEVALVYVQNHEEYLAWINHQSNTYTNGDVRMRDNRDGSYSGTYSSRSNTYGSSTPIYRHSTLGTGMVVRLNGQDSVRLLMQFSDEKKTHFERNPTTNFARAFVKAYEKANKTDGK